MTKYKMIFKCSNSGKILYSFYKDTINELAKCYLHYIDIYRKNIKVPVSFEIYELNNEKYFVNFKLIIDMMKAYTKLRTISNKLEDLNKDFHWLK